MSKHPYQAYSRSLEYILSLDSLDIIVMLYMPVLAPGASAVVSVLGATSEDKLCEVTSLGLARSVLGAGNLQS